MKYFAQMLEDYIEQQANTNVRALKMSGYYKSWRFYLNNLRYRIIKFLAEL